MTKLLEEEEDNEDNEDEDEQEKEDEEEEEHFSSILFNENKSNFQIKNCDPFFSSSSDFQKN